MAKLFYEPTFAMVEAIRAGYGDCYEVIGVFTKDEDAESLKAELEGTGYIRSGATVIQRVPMKYVVDRLIEDKLGDMAEAVKTIAAAVGDIRKEEAGGYPNG